MKSKRGDLSLSITAIVVIVIAFVVLGLGLSLTRTIFKGAEQKLPEAFAVTQLEAEPTSENPITVQQTVEIDRGKQKTLNIGFYNSKNGKVDNAQFNINNCIDSEGRPASPAPLVASPPQNVAASDSAGYSIIITERELPAGTYICSMQVCNGNSCVGEGLYESKQFFLQVIA